MQESISRILSLRFVVNAKDLGSVADQLNSMSLAIGNIVRLTSRAMYAQISAQNSWFSNFCLEDSGCGVISFLAIQFRSSQWPSYLV